MKRLLLFLVIFAMLAALPACKSKEPEESATVDTAVGGQTEDPSDDPVKKEEPSSNESKKDPQKPDQPSDSSKDPEQQGSSSDKPSDSSQQPSGGDQTPGTDPGASSAGPTRPDTLSSLQSLSFTVQEGDTLWFGPADPTRDTLLTLRAENGAELQIGKNDLTEAGSFGGGYRLFSYKVSSAGSVQVTPPEGYEDRFLISKNEEMTVEEYFYHMDSQSGINLYDGALDRSRQTIDWKGKTSQSSDYHLSHAIAVNPGDTLTFGPTRAAQVVQGYGFNAKGEASSLINGSNCTVSAVTAQGMRFFTYTVPEGIYTVQLNVGDDLMKKYMVTKNKMFSVAEYQNTTGNNAASIGDPLKEKEALFLGDSICEGWKNSNTGIARFPDAYAGLIAKETGLIATNNGLGSSTLSDGNRPVFNQLEQTKKLDFDYVLIQGGINDMSHGKKVGKMSHSYSPDTFDTTTYAGGLEYTIYKAIEYHGDTAAIAYLFTPAFLNHPSGNYSKLTQYTDVAAEICEKWGIPFFDLNKNEELIGLLDINNKTHTSDNIHLNGEGYKKVYPYIAESLRAMTPCKQEILQAVLGE
ncbi:MAG: hypothetical protein IJ333_00475 [Clostridia bacterium]|nr:hypothetical protein [Clostridia bacterium]